MLGDLWRADRLTSWRGQEGISCAPASHSYPAGGAMRNEPLLILSVIGSALIFASLTGFFLRISVRKAAAIGVVENLNRRIKAWWWIVLILGSAVFAGPAAVIALFALISFVALREFLTLTAIQAIDRPAVLASFLVILPVQYVLVGLGQYDWFVGFLPL